MSSTEIESIEIEKKFHDFLLVRKEAIDVIKKYIEKFKYKRDYESILRRLEFGLSTIEAGYNRVNKDGIEGLLADLKKYPKGKRPLFGYSRSFGEFLWQGYDWQREILEAVDKIDNYYNNM